MSTERRHETHTNAGLTPSEQLPASSLATVALDQPVTDVWRDLFGHTGVCEAFVQSLRGYCRGKTVPALYDDLTERGVPYWLHSRIRDVGRGDRDEARHLAFGIVPMLGRGRSTVGDILQTAPLFRFNDEAPTVAFELEYTSFKQLRREQREHVCQLAGELSKAFDVRLITTGLGRAYLREQHRDDLPGVSEWGTTAHTDTTVTDALAALDSNGRETQILRLLSDEPGETLTYSALYAASTTDDSRVRQCLSRLRELDLVETYGEPKRATLLNAGRDYLTELTNRVGRQSDLTESVSDTPKDDRQRRVTPSKDGGGEGRESYRTAFLGRAEHTAAVACGGSEGSITPVEEAISQYESTDRLVSYNEPRDEAVVSTHATNPLDYTVSNAIALASPRLIDAALPVDRLEDILREIPGEILRNARQIGGVSSEAVDDAAILRDNLVSWGETLEDLTRKLKHGEYEDRDAFVGEIVRSAHGLAGSVVHLLDAAGVSLTREIRVPSNLNATKIEALAESVSHSVKVQSRYESFAAYRQLFETRSDKRQTAFTPVVDAANPVGSLIGSFVIRGGGATRLTDAVRSVLETAQPHDEAPEFTVQVSINDVDRSTFAVATNRILSTKNLSVTREAVSLIHGLVSSPYAATDALNQLGKETATREIRTDELRYAFATLSPAKLLSDIPPTVGKILHALLNASERLTQTELADRAGVSTQSLRNHKATLTALDIVRVDDAAWRVSLSFSGSDERSSPVIPTVVSGEFIEAVDAIVDATLPPGRYADPDDPVGKMLWHPPNPWGIPDKDPMLAPWIRLAAALTATESPEGDTRLSVGPTVDQTSLKGGQAKARAD